MRRNLLLLALVLGASTAAAQMFSPQPDAGMGGTDMDIGMDIGADNVDMDGSEDQYEPPRWSTVFEMIERKNDTQTLLALVQAVGLNSSLAQTLYDGDLNATVFAPTDQFLDEALAEFGDIEDYSEEQLTRILSYHVVAGQSLTLDQLTNGMTLQTLVEGPDGILTVQQEDPFKPQLVTTSGQVIPIYQFDLTAANAYAHTIKGILIPANTVEGPVGAAAEAPMTGM